MQHATELEENPFSSLFEAINDGDLFIVDTLLSKDADLKTRIEVDGEEMTALQFAVDRYNPKKHNATDRLTLIFSLLSKIKRLSSSETDYAEFGVNDAFINAVNFILTPVVDHFLALGFPVDCVLPRIIALILNCSPPPPGIERKLAATFSSTIQLCVKLIPYFKPELLQEIENTIQAVEQKIKKERLHTPQHKRQVALITKSLAHLSETIKISTSSSASSSSSQTALSEENKKIDDFEAEEKKEKKQKKKKKKNKKRNKDRPPEEEIPEKIPTEPLGFLTPPTRSRRATITMMSDWMLRNIKDESNTEVGSSTSFSTLSFSSSTSSRFNSADTTPLSTPASTRAHTPIYSEEAQEYSDGIPLFDSVQHPPGLYSIRHLQVINIISLSEIRPSPTFFHPLNGIKEKLEQLSKMEVPCLKWHAFVMVNEEQKAFLFFEKPPFTLPIQGQASIVYDMKQKSLPGVYFSQNKNICYYLFPKPKAMYGALGLGWESQQPILVYPIQEAACFLQSTLNANTFKK